MKLILHNSVSIDGSLTGFDANMGLHYQLAASYKPDAHLIGSNTVTAGIEMYGEGVPDEEVSDFMKPERNSNLPYWIIPDTEGSLKGTLHTCRRFEFCRDVILLISETTPAEYIRHLEERNYDFIIAGKVKVDYNVAFKLLSKKYNTHTILADTGKVLGNILLNAQLVDEISMLIHPVLTGVDAYPMFSEIHYPIQFKLLKSEILENEFVWIKYKMIK
jgi:2,5-diamino-6-(ribosylamino)-4(3H)-pyrimidinone 5'-phosphate reductase